MTGLAEVSGIDMRAALAGSCKPVVTGDTTAYHASVVKAGIRPTGSSVTDITAIGGRDMVHVHTCSHHTIVTRLTGTQYLAMVHRQHR